ncbi:hypothetical protein EBR03_08705 [bacterium]|nr:hypothetical protein [bacterium]
MARDQLPLQRKTNAEDPRLSGAAAAQRSFENCLPEGKTNGHGDGSCVIKTTHSADKFQQMSGQGAYSPCNPLGNLSSQHS